jgi:hypothetical protein
LGAHFGVIRVGLEHFRPRAIDVLHLRFGQDSYSLIGTERSDHRGDRCPGHPVSQYSVDYFLVAGTDSKTTKACYQEIEPINVRKRGDLEQFPATLHPITYHLRKMMRHIL